MKFDEARRNLEGALLAELPGVKAHLRMSPRPRPGWEPGELPDDGRPSAGLVLVFPVDGEAHVVLTKRRDDLPHHAGQVSLPGGALDPGESFEEAALREAYEEVGADPAEIRILGEMTPLHLPVSNFNLHPVVGVAERRFDWEPHDREVARVLEVPVDTLRDPGRVREETWTLAGRDYLVPFFRIDGETVWGATAMVLAEFLALFD